MYSIRHSMGMKNYFYIIFPKKAAENSHTRFFLAARFDCLDAMQSNKGHFKMPNYYNFKNF